LLKPAQKFGSDAPLQPMSASIALVLHQSFLEYQVFYTAEGLAATTPGAEQIQQRMKEGPVWVALQLDSVVGTVSVVAKDDGLYIRSMAVLPSARRLGIGWALLTEVESFAGVAGHRRLFLSTTPFLDTAIRLYEGFGFRRSDEGPHELFGTPLFTMVKNLEEKRAQRQAPRSAWA
jgi:ribosomal protein S18 acetylase RimI-like enzyme